MVQGQCNVIVGDLFGPWSVNVGCAVEARGVYGLGTAVKLYVFCGGAKGHGIITLVYDFGPNIWYQYEWGANSFQVIDKTHGGM